MSSFTVTPNSSSSALDKQQAWMLFGEGVRHVFVRWTALQLAIDHSPYPRSPADPALDELLTHTLDFFKQHGRDIEPRELADNFNAYMGEQLGVEVQDGSPYQVGKTLMQLYRDVVEHGDARQVMLMREENAKRTNSDWQVSSMASGSQVVDDAGDLSSSDDDCDDSDDCEMMDVEETSKQEQQPKGPILDEDGFELVVRRNKKR